MSREEERRWIDRREFLRWSALVAAGTALPGVAACGGAGQPSGQNGGDFPTRPITIICPWGPGAGADMMVRAMVRAAEQISDVRFVVQNMPGAGSVTGFNHTMSQPPDGYTIHQAHTSNLFDILDGSLPFTLGEGAWPIISTQEAVCMLFIRSDDERFSNIEEFVDYARQGSNQLNVAAGGIGGFDSYVLDSLAQHFEYEYEQIPFDDGGERYASLEGGSTDALFEQPGDVMSFLESGSFKPILVYTEERMEDERFANVPTSTELGLNVTFTFGRGFLCRSEVSEEIKNYIVDLFTRAWKSQEYQKFSEEQLTDFRSEALTGEEYLRYLQNQMESFEEYIETGEVQAAQ